MPTSLVDVVLDVDVKEVHTKDAGSRGAEAWEQTQGDALSCLQEKALAGGVRISTAIDASTIALAKDVEDGGEDLADSVLFSVGSVLPCVDEAQCSCDESEAGELPPRRSEVFPFRDCKAQALAAAERARQLQRCEARHQLMVSLFGEDY